MEKESTGDWVQEFSAPQINSAELWKTSGHWAHYKEKDVYHRRPGRNQTSIKANELPQCDNSIQNEEKELQRTPTQIQ